MSEIPRNGGMRTLKRRQESGGGAISLSAKRIVIVDDNEDSRHFLEVALHTSGAAVRTFPSIDAVRKSLSELEADVFILDLALHRETGVDLLQMLRTSEREEIRNAPAICLSAHAGTVVEKLVMDAGFDRFLSKPISVRELIAEVHQLIGDQNRLD